MGALTHMHALQWTVFLSAEGYATFELRSGEGRRFGWIINAATTGWTAHRGSWDGSPFDWCDEELASFDGITEAKAWVEDGIATTWKAARWLYNRPLESGS